jgi:hypothetical protein
LLSPFSVWSQAGATVFDGAAGLGSAVTPMSRLAEARIDNGTGFFSDGARRDG